MYSILVSKIAKGMQLVNDDVEKLVKSGSKAVILPWAFPLELNSEKLMNEYFKKGGKKYHNYVGALINLGIKEEDIFIGNCYSDSSELLKEKIKNSDILVLPGGNPEMFFSKVVQDKELLYDIKHYQGIIIGESAGCELHLKRYFITAKNNYYKYFAWYDGFGIIDDPFYMDVHSVRKKFYLEKLQKIADEKKKMVYAIFDDGAIIFNRESKEIKKYGSVLEFIPQNESNS